MFKKARLLLTISLIGMSLLTGDAIHRQQTLMSIERQGIRYSLVAAQGHRWLAIEDPVGSKPYTNDLTVLQPYRLDVVDVDQDGQEDIVIGVMKYTHFDAMMKPRVFVFNYHQRNLIKKWTGSALGDAMLDYRCVPSTTEKPCLLMVIDQGEDEEGQRLKAFQWFNFGFVMIAQSEAVVGLKFEQSELADADVTKGQWLIERDKIVWQ